MFICSVRPIIIWTWYSHLIATLSLILNHSTIIVTVPKMVFNPVFINQHYVMVAVVKC